MKVLFIASEMAPYAKTGGLGDVVGSLPKYLHKLGIDARVVIPRYGHLGVGDYQFSYWVPRRRGGAGEVMVHQTRSGEVPVYLLQSWPYFGQESDLYSVWDWDTPRFIYFAQMAMGLVWELAQGRLDNGESWWPDVLHVHDWHTGLIPFLLHEARFNAGWQDIASVISIHNMAFQGPYASRWLIEEGIPNRFHPALPWQDWRDNLLAIGLAYADKLNTVSPHHAMELHYPRFGEGLQDLVWGRDADFVGIVNGIDTEVMNPATDKHLAQHFDADTFRQDRPANKLALQRELGLAENPDIPLIAYIGRITPQKGIDFSIPALYDIIFNEEVQFVGLGTGDWGLQNAFGSIGLTFGDKARTYLKFDGALAQRIYAGADMMLVPSRYEPCGLTQIMAMRYGCLPIARQTGGLVDTVENYDDGPGDQGTGFMFLFEESQALASTIRWALYTYHHRRAAWERMQERGMRRDWSWGGSAEQYRALYQSAITKKRAWRQYL
jgi:starch synthase